MPIYIYRDEEGNTFEIHQNMSDDPLTVSLETGLSCKRVITGGRPPMLDRNNVGIAEQMDRKRRKALAENPLHTSLSTYSNTMSQRTKSL